MIDTRAACSYRMKDINTTSVEGTLLCRERELFSAAKGKYALPHVVRREPRLGRDAVLARSHEHQAVRAERDVPGALS